MTKKTKKIRKSRPGNKPAGVKKTDLKPCPCGTPTVTLLLEISQGRVGNAVCSTCGVWSVGFLVPATANKEAVAESAKVSWNAAPRVK